jgi:nitrite reductase (NADH) large subunit
MILKHKKSIVVIGNGMVGHRFCERLVEYDTNHDCQITVFGEEPRPVYDRVQLTSYFAHRDPQKLQIADRKWYEDRHIALALGDPVVNIDRANKLLRSASGKEVHYDVLILATGSAPFVPPVPGIDKQGVFVYRTIEDLEKITAFSKESKRCAVVGGGLLGLEAAKAAYDLGLETHVVEFASRLMPRQVDDAGSKALVGKIEALGVKVHLNKNTQAIVGNGRVEGMAFADGSRLDVDMIVVSAGIKPRDELARSCGLAVGSRGGVVVDNQLRTSDSAIFAIGEVALYGGMIYGLIAPGYEMAEIAASQIVERDREFNGADMSTKLKLMGVDVASFGNPFADEKTARGIAFEDPFAGIYKKLFFSLDGTRLLGGILVGDASDYGTLLALCKSAKPLAMKPGDLLIGKRDGAAAGIGAMPDEAQVCSCNNVSKATICAAIKDKGLESPDAVKSCTKAGAGCGGCMPLVIDIFKAQMKAAGKKLSTALCAHFAYTRQELFDIVKIKGIRTFSDLLASHGKGNGCEICKPAVASMLASLWNEVPTDPKHHTLQDTNDRYLANIQRGGSYSVVPRVPGGEITPDKLIAMGKVAKKYGLYTKITGGQRIDMFGAQVHQLPEIWADLVAAGFESGHAYGKALRTVKSCVGSTWCRFGVQDSVGMAVRVENRYKGFRAPHKVKAAVSGCVRECAEAQSKDFGLIATENGYNLYVCGNGGAKPRHADLLAADLDEEMALRIIDRFLLYYIQTADRLTRTSVWLDKMEGGIETLRDVIVHDKLGICADLERQAQYLVDTYQCEWREVVENPEKQRLFRQFVNTDENEPSIEFVSERDQKHPAAWSTSFVPSESLTLRNGHARSKNGTNGSHGTNGHAADRHEWVFAGRVDDFPFDGGQTIKHGQTQIAVFHFASRNEWYATQNMCPHRREFVLARGILGDAAGTPKVACPVHKKTFSLQTGKCLTGENFSVETFPVKVVDGEVFVKLPPLDVLDAVFATSETCNRSCAHEPALAT